MDDPIFSPMSASSTSSCLKSPLPEVGYEEGEIPDEQSLSKQLYAGVTKMKDSIMERFSYTCR